MAFAAPAGAQSITYGRQTHAAPYTPLSGSSLIFGPRADDDEATVDLPFPFLFYGIPRNHLRVSPNGVIVFDYEGSISPSNPAPGMAAFDAGDVAPFWDDLVVSDTGEVRFAVLGVAPTRVCVVEWIGVDRYGEPGSDLRFSVSLFEGSVGHLAIAYGGVDPAATGLDGTMAIEGPLGDGPLSLVPGCTDDCATADLLGLAGQVIDLYPDRGVNLVAGALSGPAIASAGQRVSLELSITNAHAASSGSFRYAVDDRDPSGATARLFTSAPLALTAFETRALPVDVTLPLGAAAGLHTLVLVVDAGSNLTEVDELDNQAELPIRVGAATANLVAQSLSGVPSTLRAGAMLDAQALIANTGVAAAAPEVVLVLSTNPVLSGADLRLSSVTASVAAQRSSTLRLPATLPPGTRSGRYTLGAVIDPEGRVAESNELDDSVGVEVLVLGASPEVLPATLPRAALGQPYFAAFELVGAVGGGSLALSGAPPGLSFDGQNLSGTPSAAGSFALAVTVHTGTTTWTARRTLEVVDPAIPLAVVTSTLPEAAVDVEYRVTLRSVGGAGGPLRWSSTALPSGLLLAPDGTLEGRPTLAGTTTVAVEVEIGGVRAGRGLRLLVRPRPEVHLSPEVLAAAPLGMPYRHALSATGGLAPLRFVLEEGALPPGLALAADGVLAGAPSHAGRSYFVVRVEDAGAPPSFDRQGFVLEVADPGTLHIEAAVSMPFHLREPVDAHFTAKDGSPPYRWTISALPLGLVVNPSGDTAVLSLVGTPLELGLTSALVELEDAQGRRASLAVGLEVARPTLPLGGCQAVPAAELSAWGILVVLSARVVRRARGRG
ncbi:MAG: CARDB domain-containing protein [Myxococcota bacterium]